jgi:N6-L-threonylcarbamoyladenine synthase
MLGLPFPGGPAIERTAKQGNGQAYRFPRPFLNDTSRLEFSFSGLKTAVRYEIAGPGRPNFDAADIPPQRVADLAASFQEAVVDCLVGKAMLALEKTGMDTLCIGGGVAANGRFRERVTEEATRRKVKLYIPPLRLCTDNAVMGAIAVERIRAGCVEGLALNISPGLVRGEAAKT